MAVDVSGVRTVLRYGFEIVVLLWNFHNIKLFSKLAEIVKLKKKKRITKCILLKANGSKVEKSTFGIFKAIRLAISRHAMWGILRLTFCL